MQNPLASLQEFSNLTKDEEKHEFLKVLAHELRNPLATILSSIELITELGANDEATPELLRIVEDRVRAITNILNDLLSTSRKKSLDTEASIQSDIRDIHEVHIENMKSTPTLKTMVVDDNKTAADSLGQLLALRGYEVEIAYSGAQALEKAQTFRPQVAILDIGMPDMDGYELARLLRAEGSPCTYIALTGYGQTHDKKQAEVAGFDFHLTKPASLKEIEVILQKIEHAIKIAQT